MSTRYPIWILSKGRWDSRQTSKTLEMMNIPYRIAVEDQEYDNYAAVIDPKKVVAMPTDFRENPLYAISDENHAAGGGIPARNFIIETSKNEGNEASWILDDNIKYFFRLNNNYRTKVTSDATFRACEDFVDRYENVQISGMQYVFFTPKTAKRPPYYLNTRVYSCMLLKHNPLYKFRGRYNEDTDLSLRIMKDGHCTILFNAFLCGKAGTHSMKGGNTEEVYKVGNQAEFDNRYTFAKSLKDQHPDVVEIVQRYGRWHHFVDYSKFQRENKLILKEGLNIPKGFNEYGMKFAKLNKETIEAKYSIDNTIEPEDEDCEEILGED